MFWLGRYDAGRERTRECMLGAAGRPYELAPVRSTDDVRADATHIAARRRTPACIGLRLGSGLQAPASACAHRRGRRLGPCSPPPASGCAACRGCCHPSWARASRPCPSTWGRRTVTRGVPGRTAAARARRAPCCRRCAAPQLTRVLEQDSPPADVSVFKITGASASDPKLVAARNGVKRLRTVRTRAQRLRPRATQGPALLAPAARAERGLAACAAAPPSCAPVQGQRRG